MPIQKSYNSKTFSKLNTGMIMVQAKALEDNFSWVSSY